MRTFIFLIVGLLGFQVQQAFADDLCRGDEKKVLFAIDQVCGDTWCEGDFNFQFRKIRCNFTLGSCALEYRTAPWRDSEDEDFDWGKSKICVIRNVSALDQLVLMERGVPRLLDSVYDQITTCIDHLSPRHLN